MKSAKSAYHPHAEQLFPQGGWHHEQEADRHCITLTQWYFYHVLFLIDIYRLYIHQSSSTCQHPAVLKALLRRTCSTPQFNKIYSIVYLEKQPRAMEIRYNSQNGEICIILCGQLKKGTPALTPCDSSAGINILIQSDTSVNPQTSAANQISCHVLTQQKLIQDLRSLIRKISTVNCSGLTVKWRMTTITAPQANTHQLLPCVGQHSLHVLVFPKCLFSESFMSHQNWTEALKQLGLIML